MLLHYTNIFYIPIIVIGTERMQAAQSLYIPKSSWKSKPDASTLHLSHYSQYSIKYCPPV